MSTHIASQRTGGWLEGLKQLFTRRGPQAEPKQQDKPCHGSDDDCGAITSDEAVDKSSEDSFPASDPPSYTGTTSFT